MIVVDIYEENDSILYIELYLLVVFMNMSIRKIYLFLILTTLNPICLASSMQSSLFRCIQ